MKSLFITAWLFVSSLAYADLDLDTCSNPLYCKDPGAVSVTQESGTFTYIYNCREDQDQGVWFVLKEVTVNGQKSFYINDLLVDGHVTLGKSGKHGVATAVSADINLKDGNHITATCVYQ